MCPLPFLKLHLPEMSDLTDNPQISCVLESRPALNVLCDISPCCTTVFDVSALRPRPAGYICTAGHSVVTLLQYTPPSQ